MRVHVSIDMEGVAGVADAADTTPGTAHYEYCRTLMTAECNAVVDGCFEAGATEVVVNDSHGDMTNLLQSELDPRARAVRGWTKPFGMMQGLDAQMDATMFVGYHAAAGYSDGVLNHTMSTRDILGVYLNTEPAGELRINAAMAGWLGVPVVLASGDDVLCEEARSCLDHVETVEVKRAIDRFAASSLHPVRSQQLLREGARRALSYLRDARPYRVATPTTLRVDWSSTSIAALCENVPGVERVSSREVQYTSDDYSELYRLFLVLGALARSTTAI